MVCIMDDPVLQNTSVLGDLWAIILEPILRPEPEVKQLTFPEILEPDPLACFRR